MIERLGAPRVLALAATGSPPVREEIVRQLRMQHARVLTRGFGRPNLRLEVAVHADDTLKRDAAIEQAATLDGPGLLYVATRNDTQRYAEALTGRGLSAAAYHAGLTASVRSQVHCDSLESYYQEIGRAGRDGEAQRRPCTTVPKTSACARSSPRAPDPDDLARVYTAISAVGSVKIRTLAATVGMAQRSVSRQVSLLEQARMVRSGSGGIRLTGEADPAASASRALELAEERERIDQSRIAMMRSYAETRQCRRQFLLGYFGEELAGPCGNCDTRTAGTASDQESVAAAGDDEFPVDSVVSHAQWGSGTVIRNEDDRITVFFESEGYKVLSRQAIDDGNLLRH